MEVLHLDYRPPTAGWVLPLQTRLLNSTSPTLRERYSRWAEVGLSELGIAVATRLALTFYVSRRLGVLLKQLRDEIAASGELDDLLAGGYVYTPQESALLYEICAAVDAFFFEFRSCYEVLGKFLQAFGHHILDRRIAENDLLSVLSAADADTTWIDPLRLNRILFFHNTAPWIALRIDSRVPFECSLLVMKKNLRTFDDPDDYVTQPQLVETIEGFQIASWKLRDWLAVQIDEVERQTPSTA